jgi:hypothetical protein
MELVKSSVRIARNLGRFVSQVTLEQDLNIPDNKPDIEEIILRKGRVSLEGVRMAEESAELNGTLGVEVLYKSQEGKDSGETAPMEALSCDIAFKERVQMPGVTAQDYVTPVWDVEDLRVRILNSRKLTISGLITFTLEAGAIAEEELTECIEETTAERLEVDSTSREPEFLELVVRKRDSVRVREEVELGSNKPNIAKLLWKELNVGGLEYKLEEGKLHLRGDLLLFAIYQGEEEHIPLQWMEKSIPFSEELDCPQAQLDQIADICVGLPQTDVSVKPDYDGENRVLSLEVLLELSIQLSQERKCQMVSDAYSPVQELLIERHPVVLPRLLTKNNAKCKVTEKLTLPEDAACLQICYSHGHVRLDRIFVEDDLGVEGTIDVELVYMSADDHSPIKSVLQSVPFTQHLEVKGIQPDSDIHIHPQTEQLSTVMLSGTEVEVRATLDLDTLVCEEREEQIISEITERPFDEAVLAAMPGMTGYIVKEGDTLWSIAKSFYTSIDRLRRYNSLTGDNVRPGEKLLIVKEGQL